MTIDFDDKLLSKLLRYSIFMKRHDVIEIHLIKSAFLHPHKKYSIF